MDYNIPTTNLLENMTLAIATAINNRDFNPSSSAWAAMAPDFVDVNPNLKRKLKQNLTELLELLTEKA
ncbi:hypothetical protein Slin15195_G073430 [Septoria linicola]|uniref:Uncharacterized protein n=1 Tax=Septoria linicola TaxID=215465 RepID=A0A9Q9AST9_9PEZI|nr:hypothetical protein Slin15195_G073430 [Septoria linicola]